MNDTTVCTPLTDDELAAIKARAQAATPGPWIGQNDPVDEYWAEHSPQDAEFIHCSREDVPRLLATIEELQIELHNAEMNAIHGDSI